MSDSDATRSGSSGPAPSASERRTNVALRELVDEMMSSIRAAAHHELWTAEERAQYERELSTIMARVRTEALKGNETSAAPSTGEG